MTATMPPNDATNPTGATPVGAIHANPAAANLAAVAGANPVDVTLAGAAYAADAADMAATPEFKIAYDRLVAAFAHRPTRGTENPDDPDTVQAMQIALNLPKQHPPARHDLLAAAAQAVVAVCLNPQAGADTEWATALHHWYDHRIRKVTRRARNTGWRAVQELPGVTSNVNGAQARAFIPSAVHNVQPLIRKLQIKGTDLPPADHQPPLPAGTPTIYVDAGLGMSVGKTAAQVGHGSMLLAAHQPFDWVQSWARRGFDLCVAEIDSDAFAQLVDAPTAVTIRDIGYTEVAPDTATVVASPQPFDTINY